MRNERMYREEKTDDSNVAVREDLDTPKVSDRVKRIGLIMAETGREQRTVQSRKPKLRDLIDHCVC